MTLNEALRVKRVGYEGTRPDYEIHDENPNILVLDPDYKHDGNGRSILGFNLNYLDDLSAKDKKSLVNHINEYDNEIMDIKGAKAWISKAFRKGHYGFSAEGKKNRYNKIIKKFPELKKLIRRYKYSGIKGK